MVEGKELSQTDDSNSTGFAAYSEFLPEFIVETKEHLQSIEVDILTLEKNLDNVDIIHSMFRAFHTIKGLAGFVDQLLIQDIAHETETLLDQCRKGEVRVTPNRVELLLKSTDLIRNICNDISLLKNEDFMKEVQDHLQSFNGKPNESLAELEQFYEAIRALDSSDTVLCDIAKLICNKGKLTESDFKEVLSNSYTTESAEEEVAAAVEWDNFFEQATPVEAVEKSVEIANTSVAMPQVEDYVRIPAVKVDSLVDLIGELIIMHSHVEQEVTTQLEHDSLLNNTLMRMSRVTRDIQNLSMSLRMVSLKTTFQKITRIARDTIAEVDKSVNFITAGEDTEIDRGVAERLLDPLVHLVKNAISHGIEASTVRAEQGKDDTGTVTVSAHSKRGSVLIEVKDDGKGINPELIYQKALDKGLVDPELDLTDKKKLELIFLPGLSTADTTDKVSGRGVGMDVVKTEISKIGGSIDIANKLGEGCAFTLTIPINLAIMDGTILQIGPAKFIVPTHNVKQIYQPGDEDWVSVRGKDSMIRLRDEVIPLVPIYELFSLKRGSGVRLVVVLEIGQKLVAVPVDNVIDKREIVVKSLGDELRGLDYVSGASILGDGKVSLILDLENICRAGGVI